MKDLLKQFEEKRPEIVFEWKDSETEAEGWVVINSLRGGAAGGGTRMRKGLDKREVESLAKTMEVKFTVAGPQIGGAKSGINFDPSDPRKKEVLQRWYKAVKPLLKNYYGTGGDMNVDEVHDVIPITSELGILHPQEGVVRGHFGSNTDSAEKRIQNLQVGVKKRLEDSKYSPDVNQNITVSDMITGFGVAESVRHFYAVYGGDVKGKKVIVQGWGNVAAAAGYYMAQMGAKVVAIIDRVGGLINENGFSFEEIRDLYLNKNGNSLKADQMISFEEMNSKVWDIPADIFLPCAGSRLINEDQLNRMVKAGLSVISAGANVPFADKEIFLGPIGEKADQSLSLIPDFIANCGMARVFAYCMSQENVDLSDTTIFEDTSSTIRSALEKTHAKNSALKGITHTAFEIALQKLI